MAGSAFDRVNGVLVDRVILVDSEGAAITEDNPAYILISKNPLTTDNKLRVGSVPYGYDVAKGNIANHSPIFKTGFNPDVDIGDEDLWAVGGTYVYPEAEQRMEVVSSSADDDIDDGTGARTVTIWYLDSDFAEHTETVELQGVTPSNTVATDIYRINAFRVTSAGTGGAAAGDIDIRHLTNTPIYSRIAQGLTRARNSVYTVPANTELFITQLTFSVGFSTTGRYATCILRATYNDFSEEVTSLFYPYFEIGIEDGAISINLDVPMKFCEGTDLKLSAIGDASNANAIVTGSYRGWLEAEE